MAYIDDGGKVQIITGFMKYNEFEKRYREIVQRFGKNGPMLVHMRVRSAGGLGPKNCHPFKIKGGAMIHNGTLFHPEDNKGEGDECKSDTRIFADALHNILDLESVKRAEKGILAAVGNWNKLAFLYDGGGYHIINENYATCVWDDGVWFSNGGCRVASTYSGK